MSSTGFLLHRFVKALAIYVGVTFVVMEVLYLGVWCRPIYDYWAVPTPNLQCSAATNHLITNAVFNFTSDICMLVIAFTLFIHNSLSWSRKLILSLIFGLGLFTILSAVLNKYYSFRHPFGTEWTYWYVRESSTAIIVANLPFTWALIRRVFNVGSFDNKTKTSDSFHFQPARSTYTRQKPQSGIVDTSPSLSPTIRSSVHTPPPISPLSSLPPRYSSALDGGPNRNKWREAGVYGLLDADALADDIKDDDEKTAETIALSEYESHSIVAPPSTTHSSPGRSRLRSGDGQWTAQTDFQPHYLDFGTDPSGRRGSAPLEDSGSFGPPLKESDKEVV
jgi:hypothetical protein